MAARTKVWFNLTRNVTANVIGQIISFHFRLLWIKVGGSFFSYLDGYVFFDIVHLIPAMYFIFIASGGFRAPPKIVKKNPFGKEYEQLIIPIVEDNIHASSMIYLILIR